MLIFFSFIFIILIIYGITIIKYIHYWKHLEKNKRNFSTTKEFNVTIIISCRNESHNIKNIVSNFLNQNFNNKRLELILINDHSNDDTFETIKRYSEKHKRIRCINLDSYLSGKKNAIRKGISESKGDIIICTDADCLFSKNWVSKITECFSDSSIHFVSSPVSILPEGSFFSNFQEMELIALVGSTASEIYRGKPIICNGANIAFRKISYQSINSNNLKNMNLDDISLMHLFNDLYKDSIYFYNDYESIVYTYPMKNIKNIILQKTRWVSGFKSINDRHSIIISFVVFIMNFLICFLLIACIINFNFFNIFFVVFIVKIILDYFYFKELVSFFKRKYLLIYLPIFEVIHAFLSIVVVTLSYCIPIYWKGRKI